MRLFDLFKDWSLDEKIHGAIWCGGSYRMISYARKKV